MDDRALVALQLGREPRAFRRVVARCPWGMPAVTEQHPYAPGGEPFPTTYYLTCRHLVAAVSRLEAAGGVERCTDAVAAERALREELERATAEQVAIRRELAAGRRIMGFGHRIYKVRDPRAEVLAKVAENMAGAVLHDRKLFDLAREVEQTVLRVLDEVKPGRNLKTNVEFYTALVLQSIGLDPATFVAMFACGRCAGWCAHVIEQRAEDHLIRPQSAYVGRPISARRAS